MWTQGIINGYKYSLKHFDEGSCFGIDEGLISKLEIRKNGKILVNYDRDWDIVPQEAEVKAIYETILKQYN